MSTYVHPQDDGTTLLQVVDDERIQEWLIDGDCCILVAECPKEHL